MLGKHISSNTLIEETLLKPEQISKKKILAVYLRKRKSRRYVYSTLIKKITIERTKKVVKMKREKKMLFHPIEKFLFFVLSKSCKVKKKNMGEKRTLSNLQTINTFQGNCSGLLSI